MKTEQMATGNPKLSHPVITESQMLEHWQGHRKLTRRVIAAFPEDKLFQFSISGMRPFAEMAIELIDISDPGIEGMATGNWGNQDSWDHSSEKSGLSTKQAILSKWDDVTGKIDRIWPTIPADRFQEVDIAFGQYENPIFASLLYFIDNEIHHRGQGYVYLRSLGIEPPPFWER